MKFSNFDIIIVTVTALPNDRLRFVVSLISIPVKNTAAMNIINYLIAVQSNYLHEAIIFAMLWRKPTSSPFSCSSIS